MIDDTVDEMVLQDDTLRGGSVISVTGWVDISACGTLAVRCWYVTVYIAVHVVVMLFQVALLGCVLGKQGR